MLLDSDECGGKNVFNGKYLKVLNVARVALEGTCESIRLRQILNYSYTFQQKYLNKFLMTRYYSLLKNVVIYCQALIVSGLVTKMNNQ